MHLHHLLLLIFTTIPLTTPIPLNSTSLSTTTTTTTSLSLSAPPSCPRYRKRHGGHLRYRLSRLRTACRPRPQPRREEVDSLENARTRAVNVPDEKRRGVSSAGSVVDEGAAAAPDL